MSLQADFPTSFDPTLDDVSVSSNGESETQITIDGLKMSEREAKETLEATREDPMRAELKQLDRRLNAQGRRYFTETIVETIPTQIDWTSKFALTLVRYFDSHDQKKPSRTKLRIHSPFLKEIFKGIPDVFPGQSFAAKIIEIPQPYHALYHCRHELESANDELTPGSEPATHLSVLLDFISTTFAETIEASKNALEQNTIAFEHLWTLFRPGCIVLSRTADTLRAFRLMDYSYSGCVFDLQLSMVDFDGTKFGTRDARRAIRAYAGDAPITSLSSVPIELLPDQDSLRTQLIERGRRFEGFAGIHCAHHKGIGCEISGTFDQYYVEGRVMVDTKTAHRLKGNARFSVSSFDSSEASEDSISIPALDVSYTGLGDSNSDVFYEDQQQTVVHRSKTKNAQLTDDQRMLANDSVKAFSLDEKRWFELDIDKLSEVNWNLQCFDQLVLPSESKDLIRALVVTHTAKRNHDDFDDIIKGKGKGLIFVLHGPPGVGKTLTAETVAEYTKRPLYVISSGDLGTDSTHLEKSLSRALDLATTWKAVLLIDEADVFLERRESRDVKRNALVSIFLRVLEYYQGILFLTSNRVRYFDDAFKSRIHVPLQFKALDAASRRRIWKVFLARADGQHQLHEDDFESLAQQDLNGRQIKSIVRATSSLARFHGRDLDISQLQQVINIQKDFDKALDGGQ